MVRDGNIVKEETLFGSNGSNGKRVIEFEYDLTKQNLPAVSILNGKQSTNLLIREKQTTENKDQSIVYTIDYKYEYDDEGRIIRRYYLDAPSGIINLVNYQYQCFELINLSGKVVSA